MLKIQNLNLNFEGFALKDVNLHIPENQYFVLLGPSGCGKTSLIKAITGIASISKGKIIKNGKEINKLPPESRNIGYVPQHFSLFPHLNVRENISFGMKIKKYSKGKITDKINELNSLLEIEHLLHRDVKNLSGGEKQKVAIARALAIEPDLLLMDEPFASIDESFKKSLWYQLKKILNPLSIAVIHITHNFNEALALGDNIGIMIDGKIEQYGTNSFFFEKPANVEIAKFFGYRNIFQGKIKKKYNEKYSVNADNFSIVIKTEKNFQLEDEITFCIREQDLKIIKENVPVHPVLVDNIYSGKIIDSVFYTNFVTIYFKVDKSTAYYDFELTFPIHIYKRYSLSNNKKIKVSVWQENVIVF